MWGFNFDIIYIGLNLLLLFIFYRSGVCISKGKNYWQNASKCIIAFTIILGARYMRGNDYEHYLDVYKNDLESSQWFYTFMCDVMKSLGINEYGSFFIYALIFSFCLFVLLKRYKQYAIYIFPMALIFLLYFHEFMIRQALGYSFVFLYINKLFDISVDNSKLKDLFKRKNFKNLLWCTLFFLLTVGTHSANVFVIVGITLTYIFIHKPIPLILSIPALIFATYLFSELFNLNTLTPILNYIGGTNSKFTNYVNHADIWFSAEGMNDIYTRNPFIQFIELLGNIAVFLLGLQVIKKYEANPQFYTFYNCFIFGTIFQLGFLNLEIMNRMGYVFRILIFFVLGLILFYRKNLLMIKANRLFFIFMFFQFYDYLKNLFYRTEMTKFLWDI